MKEDKKKGINSEDCTAETFRIESKDQEAEGKGKLWKNR